MLVEPDAGAGLGHDRCERGFADLKRIAPQVVAVQFNEVEGVEEDALVSALVPDEIERSNAVVIAGDSFAIDDAGARAQACQCLDDQREAAGEIVAGTAIEPHPLAVLAGNDAKAIVLDLVQPLAAGRQLIGFGWKARRDEPGREGAHTQHNAAYLGTIAAHLNLFDLRVSCFRMISATHALAYYRGVPNSSSLEA